MENAERFLNAYAVIEHELQKMLNLKDHRFYDMVNMAAKVNPVISRYKFDLREWRFGNAIVHDRAVVKLLPCPMMMVCILKHCQRPGGALRVIPVSKKAYPL